MFQELERLHHLLRTFDKELRESDRTVANAADMIHDDALQRPLQEINAIVKTIGERVDVLTIDRRDERLVEFVNDPVIDGVRLMLKIDDLAHLRFRLAVVLHDLIHHHSAFMEILGAFEEQVEKLRVLVLEIKHVLPPRI